MGGQAQFHTVAIHACQNLFSVSPVCKSVKSRFLLFSFFFFSSSREYFVDSRDASFRPLKSHRVIHFPGKYFPRINPSLANRVRVRTRGKRGCSPVGLCFSIRAMMIKFGEWAEYAKLLSYRFYIFLSYHFHLLFSKLFLSEIVIIFFLNNILFQSLQKFVYSILLIILLMILKERERKRDRRVRDKSVKLRDRISQTFMNRDPLFREGSFFTIHSRACILKGTEV